MRGKIHELRLRGKVWNKQVDLTVISTVVIRHHRSQRDHQESKGIRRKGGNLWQILVSNYRNGEGREDDPLKKT